MNALFHCCLSEQKGAVADHGGAISFVPTKKGDDDNDNKGNHNDKVQTLLLHLFGLNATCKTEKTNHVTHLQINPVNVVGAFAMLDCILPFVQRNGEICFHKWVLQSQATDKGRVVGQMQQNVPEQQPSQNFDTTTTVNL